MQRVATWVASIEVGRGACGVRCFIKRYKCALCATWLPGGLCTQYRLSALSGFCEHALFPEPTALRASCHRHQGQCLGRPAVLRVRCIRV